MNIRIAKKIVELKSSLSYKARRETIIMPDGEMRTALVHYKLSEGYKVLHESGLIAEEVSADGRTVTARMRCGKRARVWSWKI